MLEIKSGIYLPDNTEIVFYEDNGKFTDNYFVSKWLASKSIDNNCNAYFDSEINPNDSHEDNVKRFANALYDIAILFME